MKKILSSLAILLFVFILLACGGQNTKQESTDKSKFETTTVADNRVEVIDFYGTHRCVTCKAIESNAKYTVETFFPREIADGKIVFKTVNVDDESNYDMAEEYETTGTALFLNIVKGDAETHVDLTDFGFAKGKEKDDFSALLKDKIQSALNQL